MHRAVPLAMSLLLIALVVAPVATAGPEPHCMERYAEYHVGPFTIVSRNTCHYDVQYNGGGGCGGLLCA